MIRASEVMLINSEGGVKQGIVPILDALETVT